MEQVVRWMVAGAVMVAAVAASPAVASAESRRGENRGDKLVVVCQPARDGSLHERRVAPAAAAQHARRGRPIPGAEIADAPGYVVGPDCTPLQIVIDIDGDGVPDEEDNCAAVANPEQTDRYGSPAGDACEDSNSNGIPDTNEPHICLSVNGVTLLAQGSASCLSADGGNLAMAHGAQARATAVMGAANHASADGDGARAIAQLGNNNTAVSRGVGASAIAQVGDNNQAMATGPLAGAFAGNGSNNVAEAEGTCSAIATGGDNLSAACPAEGA